VRSAGSSYSVSSFIPAHKCVSRRRPRRRGGASYRNSTCWDCTSPRLSFILFRLY